MMMMRMMRIMYSCDKQSLLSLTMTSLNTSMVGLLSHLMLMMKKNLLIVDQLIGLIQPLLIVTILLRLALILILLSKLQLLLFQSLFMNLSININIIMN